MTIYNRLGSQLIWTVYLLLLLLVALFLSWHISARANFLYPIWHDVIGIEATVQHYGPLNRFREDFQHTTKQERTRLFAGIVSAIHKQGEGLESLHYRDSDGQDIGPLLTRPEIIHLQDVARLIDWINQAGLFILGIWLLLSAWIIVRKIVMPRPLRLLVSGITGVALSIFVVLLLGPVRVFYQLHEWIFPDGHQWFFYYEESLLTMMMKAPVLFGPIALMLVIIALLLCALSVWGLRLLLIPRAEKT